MTQIIQIQVKIKTKTNTKTTVDTLMIIRSISKIFPDMNQDWQVMMIVGCIRQYYCTVSKIIINLRYASYQILYIY